MPKRLPIRHQGHGHVSVATILHEIPYLVRNLRNLCKQNFPLTMDGLDPAEGRIAHCRVAEDERRFAVLWIVAGGDGVEVGFGKTLRTALRIDEAACPGDGNTNCGVGRLLTPERLMGKIWMELRATSRRGAGVII